MIRRSLPEGDLLVTQHEHALLAARLAMLLANLPEPREAILRAISMHDAGWALLDDAPLPLPDGRPPHVFDLPPGESLPAWRRSVAIARACGVYEGLIVSRHFGDLRPEFRREQAREEAVWRATIDPAAERGGVDALALADALSLGAICSQGLPHGYQLRGTELSPWPFRMARLREVVVGRLVPRRLWPKDGSLLSAYRSAPPHPLWIDLTGPAAD